MRNATRTCARHSSRSSPRRPDGHDVDRLDVAQGLLRVGERVLHGVVGARGGAPDELDDLDDGHPSPLGRLSLVRPYSSARRARSRARSWARSRPVSRRTQASARRSGWRRSAPGRRRRARARGGRAARRPPRGGGAPAARGARRRRPGPWRGRRRGAAPPRDAARSAPRRRGRAGRGRGPRRTGTRPGRTARARRSVAVRAATAGGDRPADRRAARPRARARRTRSRAGSSGGCTSAGSSARARPGSGCALRCVEPSALSRRGARRASRSASEGDEIEEAGIEQLDVGIEQGHHVGRGPRDARVVRRAEAGVAGELDDLGPALAGQGAPASRDPESTTTSCGRSGRWPRSRPAAGRRSGAESCDDDDRRERHRAAASRQDRVPARAAASHVGGATARAAAPAVAAQLRLARHADERPRQRDLVSGAAPKDVVAQRLARTPGGRTRSTACRTPAASSGGSPKPSSQRGHDERERPRTAPRAPGVSARRIRGCPAACRDDARPAGADERQVGVQARPPRPAGAPRASTSGALRGSSAPTHRK